LEGNVALPEHTEVVERQGGSRFRHYVFAAVRDEFTRAPRGGRLIALYQSRTRKQSPTAKQLIPLPAGASELAPMPVRTGLALLTGVQVDARAAGVSNYLTYGLATLEHPAEIAEFVHHYHDVYPPRQVFLGFVRGVRPGTARIWEDALEADSRARLAKK
jgi:hypothetical protein